MNQTFEHLGIGPVLTTALGHMEIIVPMAIQQAALPPILAGKHVIGQSATGTGKTLAYLLPLVQRLDGSKQDVQAVVLAPTYELAMQIYRQLELIIQHSGLGIRALSLIGGANIARQIEKLKTKPHIVVASGGRLIELVQKHKIKLQAVECLVLDEADKLLDDQNLSITQTVLKHVQASCQLLLFSATMRKKSFERANALKADFTVIQLAHKDDQPKIEHLYVLTEHRTKLDDLRKLIRNLPIQQGLVFVNRGSLVEATTEKLNYLGIRAASLHGGNDQLGRKKALHDFRAGRLQVLVASDIAARGLDIEGIDCVVNLDMTDDSEVYLHRVGRTGRAGRSGTAISLVARQEMWMVEKISRALKDPLQQQRLIDGRLEPIVRKQLASARTAGKNVVKQRVKQR